MSRLILAAVAAVFASHAAMAADEGVFSSQSAAHNWSGAYVGLNLGHVWSEIENTNATITTSGPLVGLMPGTFEDAVTFDGADRSGRLNGMAVGGQMGFNFQEGSFVYGVEADYQSAGIKLNSSFHATEEGPYYETIAELKHFGTLRARLGYAVDSVLLYGTGGLAIARSGGFLSITGGTRDAPVGASYTDKQSEWLTGFTVGAGTEVAIANSNWSVKTEYLYANFGAKTLNFSFPETEDGSSARNRSHLDAHLVRIGLNYRF